MQKIVEWLLGMEEQARDLYLGSARTFMQDPALSKFLDDLGKDEAGHAKYMEVALRHVRKHPLPEPTPIVLDEATRDRIEKPFRKTLATLRAGKLSKEALLDAVGLAEFSEWNDLFLYVVKTLTPQHRELELGASQMPAHIQKVKDFAEGPSGSPELVRRFREIGEVWKRKILVVDANQTVQDLLAALFRGEANVSGSTNGKDALARIRSEYFDVILTDFDLPGWSGMELFKRAAADDPALGRHFLFFSGLLTREHKMFLTQHSLPHLHKPGGIQALRDAVGAVAEKAAKA